MQKDLNFLNKRIEWLDQYNRSNQDTCLVHKPAVNIGEWVEAGDLLADSSASMNGELAIGKNIIVAYMPWEGFNYEDAILINERLVYDDVYTSIHIERYEIETKEGLNGSEQITREIPDISPEAVSHLDAMGIAKVGSWIEEGTILVGKITPVNKKAASQTPYQRLLFKLLEKNISTVRDSSLRAPKGIKANVIYVNILAASTDLDSTLSNSKSKQKNKKFLQASKNQTSKKKNVLPLSLRETRREGKAINWAPIKQEKIFQSKLNPNSLRTPLDFNQTNTRFDPTYADPSLLDSYTLEFSQLKKWLKKQVVQKKIGITVNDFTLPSTILPNQSLGLHTPVGLKGFKSLKGLKTHTPLQPHRLVQADKIFRHPCLNLFLKPFLDKNNKGARLPLFEKEVTKIMLNADHNKSNLLQQSANSLKGLNKFKKIPTNVHIYLAEKRKIQVGDKMAGRHGNKGIISNILPREDMPYLPDGTPVDIVLNPLGVPSRMNVGQIYECLLGLAGKHLGEHYKISPFDEMYGAEASRSFVFSKLFEASKKTGIEWLFDPNSPGKMRIFDGRTSESFDQPVTVGIAYMLKLVHMVDDKVHCLTPGHDVLTTDGWVPIDQLTLNHTVATLNQNFELTYQKPTEILNFDYNGQIYTIENSHLSLQVTTNHRMLVKKGTLYGQSFTGYQLIEAEKLVGKHYKYLKNAKNTLPDYQFVLPAVKNNSINQMIPAKPVPMDPWLTFFGLWMAKGWANTNQLSKIATAKTNQLSKIATAKTHLTSSCSNVAIDQTKLNVDNKTNTIMTNTQVFARIATYSLIATAKQTTKAVYSVELCQVKPDVVDIIKKAIGQLGYNSQDYKNLKYKVNDKQLWTYLKPLSVGAPNKFLPDWVWLLSEKQSRTLLNAMCLGDGTWRGNSPSYYTSSKRLADDVMRLALHCGWSANLYLHLPAGTVGGTIDGRLIRSNNDVWRVSIIQTKNSPAVNHGHHKKQSIQKETLSLYQGKVHCISVPNQIFYVRRNGLTAWTGNSRSTGPYSLVTQQPLRGRAKQGGQRLGEMEVWAIEGYGAAFVLLEMLTLKSDDMTGRLTLWSNLILNKEITIGTPESFKVLVCELQALCLDIGLFHFNNTSNINSDGNPLGFNSDLNTNLTDVNTNKPKKQLLLTEISHLMLLP